MKSYFSAHENTLKRTIQRSMIIASLMLVVSISLIQVLIDYSLSQNQLENKIEEFKRTISPSLAIALSENDNNLIKATADQLLTNEELLGITISDNNQQLRYQNFKGRQASTQFIKEIQIANPNIENNHIGLLRITYTHDFLRKKVSNSLLQIVLFNSIKIAILILIITGLLTQKVVNPLRKLSEAIRRLPQNAGLENHEELFQQIITPQTHNNEIGILARFIRQREHRLGQLSKI
jgi:hypothetical protein